MMILHCGHIWLGQPKVTFLWEVERGSKEMSRGSLNCLLKKGILCISDPFPMLFKL